MNPYDRFRSAAQLRYIPGVGFLTAEHTICQTGGRWVVYDLGLRSIESFTDLIDAIDRAVWLDNNPPHLRGEA